MADETKDVDRIEFTENELIQALVNALDFDTGDEFAGFMTARELMKATGLNSGRLNRLIDELMDVGRIEAMRVPRRNRLGDMQKVAAYRLKE